MAMEMPQKGPRRYSSAALKGICQDMQAASQPSKYHQLISLQPKIKAQLSSFANQCLVRMLCASFPQPLGDLHYQARPFNDEEGPRMMSGVELEVLMWPVPATDSAFITNLSRCLDDQLSLRSAEELIGHQKVPGHVLGPHRVFPMRAFNQICSSEASYEALLFLKCDRALKTAALAPPARIRFGLEPVNLMPLDCWRKVGQELASLEGTGLLGASVLAPAIHKLQLLHSQCAEAAEQAWAKLSGECSNFIQCCSGLSTVLNRLDTPAAPSFHNLSARLKFSPEKTVKITAKAKPILGALQLLFKYILHFRFHAAVCC